MNEIEELSKIDFKTLPPLKSMHYDNLHSNVLKHLYLELGTGPVLFLLSPSYTVINPTPNEEINDFIRKDHLVSVANAEKAVCPSMDTSISFS